MSNAFPLFEEAAADLAKQRGMEQAANNRAEVLEDARAFARMVANRQGTVTIDDVQQILSANGYPPLGNSAGSLFKGGDWVFTGSWAKSTRVTNHARMNRVWRMR